MGTIRSFNPVKCFAGILVSDLRLIIAVRDRLVESYGPIDHESRVIRFDFTDYYVAEMGPNIHRIFFSFERLIEADELSAIKHQTNLLEQSFTPIAVRRPVNIDPGYLENAKVVLASTKNFYHRIYLTRGIFAEVTMHFRNNAFQFFQWTYPDYQSPEYQEFFIQLRQLYRSQLRTMCLLNREGSK